MIIYLPASAKYDIFVVDSKVPTDKSACKLNLRNNESTGDLGEYDASYSAIR